MCKGESQYRLVLLWDVDSNHKSDFKKRKNKSLLMSVNLMTVFCGKSCDLSKSHDLQSCE